MKVNFWQIIGIVVIIACVVLYAKRHANAPTGPTTTQVK
jgi:hypothetical protein